MATALVTGASSGIGAAFARELARRGHDVVLVARDRARLQRLADELRRGHAVQAEVLVADLAVPEQLEPVAARLADPERPVGLLVNNAGFGLGKGFLQGELDDEVRLLDVLCRAVVVLSHAAAHAMVTRGHGAIVNVSSIGAYVAMGSYSAAKAWVLVFSEGLSAELSGTGVTVTAVCPGFTRTEFQQRAGLDVSLLPSAAWIDADVVVRECLHDVARGRVVSVPTLRYRVLVGVLKVTPRRFLRGAGGEVAGRAPTLTARR
ncbi:MAG: SDR family NAD(P)-dependent oxidoreductase [Dermatophilaceae bacterium]